MSKLWRVVVTREQDQELFVMAETMDDAEEDARVLAESDPSCWQSYDLEAWATPTDGLPDYAEVWTGGPHGKWESTVPSEAPVSDEKATESDPGTDGA